MACELNKLADPSRPSRSVTWCRATCVPDPPFCAGVGSDAVRVSGRRIWVFCALGAGSCARCVYEERDPVLEVLLTCCVYYRDFQPVAADTEIGR
jgi:hypothetical protein